MAQYTLDKTLTNTNGWKWAKKYKKDVKRFYKLLARVNANTKATTMGRKNMLMFGVQVPDNFEHAHLLDKGYIVG